MKALKFVIRVTDPKVLECYENDSDEHILHLFRSAVPEYWVEDGVTIEVVREEEKPLNTKEDGHV